MSQQKVQYWILEGLVNDVGNRMVDLVKEGWTLVGPIAPSGGRGYPKECIATLERKVD